MFNNSSDFYIIRITVDDENVETDGILSIIKTFYFIDYLKF